MKTIMKRFSSIFLAFCMIFVFSSSVIVSAVDEIADSNAVEYYIEYDYVNQTYQRIPVNSIPDYASMTTTTYELSAMASELPRLQAINNSLNTDSDIEPFANLDDEYKSTPQTSDPYSGVVLILFRVGKDWYRGTGFMVAPDVLVTAGHNMVKYENGEFKSLEFRVYPYYSSITTPLAGDNDYISPLMWTCYDYSDAMISTNGNSDSIEAFKYDWCVVQLQESIPDAYNFACETGVSTSIFTKYYASGYPNCVVAGCTNNNCIKNGDHIEMFVQGTSEDLIRKKDDYMVYYTNNTRGGMSGGPIYKKSNNVCYAIITSEGFTGEYEGYNGGTIINDKIYNAIAYYIER